MNLVMTKMIFKAFSKRLFGVRYERLLRNLAVCVLVFWGLHIAQLEVEIASSVLYLMISCFTAGVMWQALSSKDIVADMQNMLMLPLEGREFVCAYVAALGSYTILTKTGLLLAVVLAVASWNYLEVLGSMLCAVNAVLMTAYIYTRIYAHIYVYIHSRIHVCMRAYRTYGYVCGLWVIAGIASILCWGRAAWFPAVLFANTVLSALLLFFTRVDGYAFYREAGIGMGIRVGNRVRIGKRSVKARRSPSFCRYFLRYMQCHKNYLLNTIIMWGVAGALPLLLKGQDTALVLPLGFVILSINTPICILLSCDPALEQALRLLPGQGRGFCIPYSLFIFISNMLADTIFLCSCQLQLGGVSPWMVGTAFFFALQSAICSVLLEWFYPIRGWKIESDLWHHPRKYLVPLVLLLLLSIQYV